MDIYQSEKFALVGMVPHFYKRSSYIRNSLAIQAWLKYFLRKNRATLTRPISTGTSTSGPMTALRHNPEIHYA